MKKLSQKARKRAKAHTRKKPQSGDAVLDLISSLDADQLAQLLDVMQNSQLGAGPDPGASFDEDTIALFKSYLDSCADRSSDDDKKAEITAELLDALADLRIEANGGRREARDAMQAIRDLLDEAIEQQLLAPPDILLTGKLLTDAQWEVPESVKQAMLKALETPMPMADGAEADHDIVASILELAEEGGNNPFDLYENIKAIFASLPSQAGSLLLPSFLAGNKPLIIQAVAGFLLYPDAELAEAAAQALAQAAQQAPVASTLIERLVRMRPWLPPERQSQLDAAVRSMRANALPPAKAATPKTLKCYASICDGTGAQSFLMTQRLAGHHQLATVMLKSSGIADAMIIGPLPKSEMDKIVYQMKAATPTRETDLASISRMLQLALGENRAAGTLPPFKFVEVAEALGFGALHPDAASPSEIITGLLADLPPDETDAKAVEAAYNDLLDSEFTTSWFEAGEAVEDLLDPIKGTSKRVAKLLRDHLPKRRAFWARQCAMSALALRGAGKAANTPWKQLALIGRDIAGDLPIDRIPLMQQIAEVSVEAFEFSL